MTRIYEMLKKNTVGSRVNPYDMFSYSCYFSVFVTVSVSEV